MPDVEKRVIRKANIRDVKRIHALVNFYSKKGELLPRSLNEIYEDLRDLSVYDLEGQIVGVCALHINWEDLAEIRSLAVKEECGGQGYGTELVKKCLEEAQQLEISRIYTLTYRPEFFERLGFKRIEKSQLPQKVWGDCIKCFKFPECDEIALIHPVID
jgi:amino-acid N-acetyltransferase